jgi:hypothetical protein
MGSFLNGLSPRMPSQSLRKPGKVSLSWYQRTPAYSKGLLQADLQVKLLLFTRDVMMETFPLSVHSPILSVLPNPHCFRRIGGNSW